uniref:Putative DegT/DnrJ/EryC1/StrS aminotransferase family protein n=1 Tax=viral metagenome TaxID=1070528 RepID=A0A6M3KE08_9ZZZZ
MKAIPFCEPYVTKDYAEAVYNQVLSGWLGPGEEGEKFARSIEEYMEVKHCVLTTSGTVGLQVAAKVLGVDIVVVPAYGVMSVPNAFAYEGLHVAFVDTDKRTGNIDPNALERLLEILPWDDTWRSAVCFVDFSGTLEGIQEVRYLCDYYGLSMIEDASCAMGMHDAGTTGDIAVLSFSPHKLITTGQGGAVITNKAAYAHKARDYVNHGRETGEGEVIGSNLRMSDIQAALGNAQMVDILRRTGGKAATYFALQEVLGARLFCPSGRVTLHNIVFIKSPPPYGRARLITELRSVGIVAKAQYNAYTKTPCYRSNERFPSALWWSEHAVYLPFGTALTVDDAYKMGKAVDSLAVGDLELYDREELQCLKALL